MGQEWKAVVVLMLVLSGSRVVAQDENAARDPGVVLAWARELEKAPLPRQYDVLEKLAASGSAVVPVLPLLMPLADDGQCMSLVILCLDNAGPAAVPFLVELLADSERGPRLHTAVCRLIGKQSEHAAAAMPVLVQRAREADPSRRYSFISSLSALGSAAVPYLLELYQSEDTALRAHAVDGLNWNPNGVLHVERALRDADESVRLRAMRCLRYSSLGIESREPAAAAEFGLHELAGLFFRRGSDIDSAVRRIRWLARIRHPSIVPALLLRMPEVDDLFWGQGRAKIYEEIVRAIAAAGTEEAVPALTETIAKHSGPVRDWAVVGLGFMLPATRAQLEALSESSDAALALRARIVLDRHGEELRNLRDLNLPFEGLAVENLQGQPDHLWLARRVSSDRWVRRPALMSRERPSESVILAALQHPEEAVRLGAVYAIGTGASPNQEEVIAGLVERLTDTERVRQEAASKLAMIWRSGSVPAKFLAEFTSALPGSSPLGKQQLLGLIAMMGADGRPALEQVISLLSHGTIEVACQACGTLAALGEKSEAVTAALLHATRHRAGAVRRLALASLKSLEYSPPDWEEIKPLLADENTWVQKLAAQMVCGTAAEMTRVLARLGSFEDYARRQLLGVIVEYEAPRMLAERAIAEHEARRKQASRSIRYGPSGPGPGRRPDHGPLPSRSGYGPDGRLLPPVEGLTRALLEEAIRDCPHQAQVAAARAWLGLEVPPEEARPVLERILAFHDLNFTASGRLNALDPNWATPERTREFIDVSRGGSRMIGQLLTMGPNGVRAAVEHLMSSNVGLGFNQSQQLPPAVFEFLIGYLQTGSIEQRVRATGLLSKLRFSEDVTPMVKQAVLLMVESLDHADPRIVEASAKYLCAIGPLGHQTLGKRIFDPRRQERLRALLQLSAPNMLLFMVLSRGGGQELVPRHSVPVLMAGVRDPMPYFQGLAISQLAAVPKRSVMSPEEGSIRTALPVLLGIALDIGNPNHQLARKTILDAGCDDLALLPVLLETTESKDASSRAFALQLLSKMRAETDRILPIYWSELRRVERGDHLHAAACSLGRAAVPFVAFGLRRGWFDAKAIAELGMDAALMPPMLERANKYSGHQLADVVELCLPLMSDAQKQELHAILVRRYPKNPNENLNLHRVLWPSILRLGEVPRIDVEAHIEVLGSAGDDVKIRKTLNHLRVLGPAAKGATDVLIELVEKGGRYCRDAIQVLGEVHANSTGEQTERVLAELLQVVGQNNGEVKRSLQKIGKQSLPAVLQEIRESNDERLKSQLIRLVQHRIEVDPESILQIIESEVELFGDRRRYLTAALMNRLRTHPRVLDLAPRLLVLLERDSLDTSDQLQFLGTCGLPTLLGRLSSENKLTVRAALKAIGEIGPVAADVIPQLLEHARSEASLRIPVAKTLIHLGQRGSIAVDDLELDLEETTAVFAELRIRLAVKHDERALGEVRTRVKAIEKHGRSVLGARSVDLGHYILSPHPEIRRWAQIGMTVGGPLQSPEVIIGPLADSNPAVRRRAAQAFRALASPDLPAKWLPTLVIALEDDDPVVRVELIRALGKLGLRGAVAVPALEDHAEDAEPEVQAAVVEALGLIRRAR